MHRPIRFVALLAMLAGAGCVALGGGSRPTTFYLLSPLSTGSGSAQAPSPAGVAIGVGPVEIPAHLNRPQIVTRAADNRLVLAEFRSWGEPLRDNLGRVLAENLSLLLGTERVFVYPWNRSTPIEYRLRFSFTRFAAGPDENVHLRCRWTLSDSAGKTLFTRFSRFDEPAPLDDYDAIVAAMSRSVAKLSSEIAAAVPQSPR